MNTALPDDTDEVQEGVKQYAAHELRKDLYEVAAEKRAVGEAKLAIKLLLLGWNWRAYAGTEITNTEIDGHIEELLRRAKPLVRHFEDSGSTLKSVDFRTLVEGTPVETHVIDLYDYLMAQPAIDATGASKAMHMLFPSVFMMWDDTIVKRYHQEGEDRHWPNGAGKGVHKRGCATCYVTFLEETQYFIRSSLDVTRFPEKGPAKVMDEYNYAKYTL